MQNIFDTILSSRDNLGDIGVLVDPFTGKTNTHIPVVTRFPNGPIMDMKKFLDSVQMQMLKGQIDVDSVKAPLLTLTDTFNPGIAHYNGKYVMLVRASNTSRIQDIYLAESEDGINWKHNPVSIKLNGIPSSPNPVFKELNPDLDDDTQWHAGAYYDPRITQLEDGGYIVALAVDYDTQENEKGEYFNVCDNILFFTEDFENYEFLTTAAGNTRNMVVFPRKIDGMYYAAARPNREISGVDTFLFKSKNKIHWEMDKKLFSGGHGWMCCAGPGFPPFETENYWVMGVHGVETHGEHRVHYRAGVCLIDKKSMQVVAGPVPILDPTEIYELTGIVDNVIFPTGVLFSDGNANGIKSYDTKIAIYYGGGDRVVHVGLSTVGKLVQYANAKYQHFISKN
jgi:predicted GH43/DUF377 family glycosyl hydrolase